MINYALWWDNIATQEQKEAVVWAMLRVSRKRVNQCHVDYYEPLYLNWEYVKTREKKRLIPYIKRAAGQKPDPTTPTIKQVA